MLALRAQIPQVFRAAAELSDADPSSLVLRVGGRDLSFLVGANYATAVEDVPALAGGAAVAVGRAA